MAPKTYDCLTGSGTSGRWTISSLLNDCLSSQPVSVYSCPPAASRRAAQKESYQLSKEASVLERYLAETGQGLDAALRSDQGRSELLTLLFPACLDILQSRSDGSPGFRW